MYTPAEVLDQIYAGGGQQFGDNDNLMVQVEPEGFEGAGRDRADSRRGGSSIDSSLSSASEGGSLTDSISRMNIQKSLSLEDEVFQQGNNFVFSKTPRTLTERIINAYYLQTSTR